jgi:hypothetical protein
MLLRRLFDEPAIAAAHSGGIAAPAMPRLALFGGWFGAAKPFYGWS